MADINHFCKFVGITSSKSMSLQASFDVIGGFGVINCSFSQRSPDMSVQGTLGFLLSWGFLSCFTTIDESSVLSPSSLKIFVV